MFRRGIPTISVFCLAVILINGCGNYANFPPLNGGSASAKATDAPVPEVAATSIEWCLAREDFRVAETPVVFSLPSGMGDEAHEMVASRLRESGYQVSQTGDEPGIEIRSIRLYGLDGAVDLSVPRGRNPRQLVTLNLRSYPFQQWSVISANRWRFNESQLTRIHDELQETNVTVDQSEDSP